MTDPASDTRPRLLVMIPMGWSVRNYAYSGFFDRLRERMHVTIALRFRDEALEKILRPGADEICELPAGPVTGVVRLVHEAITRAHRHHRTTFSFRYRKEEAWQKLKGKPVAKAQLALLDAGARFLGWDRVFPTASKVQRRVLCSQYAHSAVARLLDQTRPDVVFSTMPVSEPERPVLVLAKARKIPVATAVLSWDNLSTKGYMPVRFDRYFLWSEMMARDLHHYHAESQPSDVAITGAPQFDLHVGGSDIMSHAEFCQRLGFDENRPIVTYSTAPDSLLEGEEWIVRGLAEGFAANRIPGRPQLLVRLHPVDQSPRYNVAEQFGARVVRPWALDPRHKTWSYPTADDMRMLLATLQHTDVNVNFGSTMSIDFAVFGKPVINVAIDTPATLKAGIDLPYLYGWDHLQPLLRNKAVRLVRTMDELFDAVNEGLVNPAQDAEGRARMVQEVCGTIDGHAGDRIAAELINFRQWGAA